jgi:hypothetical protein
MTDYLLTQTKSSFLATKKDNRAFFSIMNSKKLPFLKIHPCFKTSNRRGLEPPLSYTDINAAISLQIMLIIQTHPLAEDIKISILSEESQI